VQPPGGMLLNDKAQTFGRGYRARTAGLGGFLEVALGAVFGQFRLATTPSRGVCKEQSLTQELRPRQRLPATRLFFDQPFGGHRLEHVRPCLDALYVAFELGPISTPTLAPQPER